MLSVSCHDEFNKSMMVELGYRAGRTGIRGEKDDGQERNGKERKTERNELSKVEARVPFLLPTLPNLAALDACAY